MAWSGLDCERCSSCDKAVLCCPVLSVVSAQSAADILCRRSPCRCPPPHSARCVDPDCESCTCHSGSPSRVRWSSPVDRLQHFLSSATFSPALNPPPPSTLPCPNRSPRRTAKQRPTQFQCPMTRLRTHASTSALTMTATRLTTTTTLLVYVARRCLAAVRRPTHCPVPLLFHFADFRRAFVDAAVRHRRRLHCR